MSTVTGPNIMSEPHMSHAAEINVILIYIVLQQMGHINYNHDRC